MDLPIPRTLRGWTIAILASIVAFTAYYGFLFHYLSEFYNDFLYTDVEQSTESGETAKLTVRADVPLHLAPFGPRWVYFTVRNNTEHPISDVWIGIQVQRGDEVKVEGWSYPFLFRGSPLLERSIHINQLQPDLPFSGRLPLFSSAPSSSPLAITLVITSTEVGWIQEFPGIKVNPYRYLAHSFIEQILLPPWSNGFVLIAVFVVCTQIEKRFKPEEEWYLWLLKALRASLALLLLLGGVALILPSMLWRQGDIRGAIIAVLFLCFFGLYGLRALGVNPPPFLQRIEKAVSNFLQCVRKTVFNGIKILRPFLRRAGKSRFGGLRRLVAWVKAKALGYVLALALVWIIGQKWQPALPLLQPLPWMALAGAVLGVIIELLLPTHALREESDESARSST